MFGLNGMIARQPMKTTNSFGLMPAASGLLHTPLDALHRDGFAIVPGPIAREEVQTFADTYDKAIREADPSDTRHGSTTTRVDDLVNRGPEFDCIYVHPPLLAACWRVFMQPFKVEHDACQNTAAWIAVAETTPGLSSRRGRVDHGGIHPHG